MNKSLLFIILLINLFLISCGETTFNDDLNTNDTTESVLNKQNSKEAFDYLNAVRENPAAYSKELAVDLSAVEKRKKLEWNEELAKAAYNKAKDMADRNYFDHVDHVDPDGYGMNYKIDKAGFYLADYLLKDKDANSFESIAAGTNRNTGKIMIQQLIIDKNVPENGHRKHLLGMTKFWANAKYCGIGFYKNPDSKYTYYICVLIAKHE